ncbi:non-ribosomal peptide synthetase [Mesorhizobium sp. CO1-1-8]|uniref:non-ribosomal peptide synthetase n=1 Tax=Mesorhizobium sp. CO1-1-8 TaxID=2876631 RepID=UPI001CD09F01|nr:non-ribosomal peptide synthetase [Mesorhizobium sp. CO1-1-8]MBZ9770994.1 amino acid adenylation domain-containing protein [Mesorhizobium sp. CO1-1-8]
MSLYILMVAALKAFAARTTGDGNLAVLSPSYAADGADAPGHTLFLTSLVARSDDLRSAILKARRMIVGGYSNQGVSLTEVFGAKLAESIQADTPLCALATIHKADSTRRKSPFELWFDRSGQRISWSIIFDADHFRSDLVAEFSSYFKQFLVAAIADYSIAIDDIDFLSDVEKERIAAFSLGPVADLPETRLDAMVSAQVSKTAGACALVCGEFRLSYADLEAQAGQVCAGLEAMGIGSGKTVALRMAAGINAVVVQLAIMKSGAAFCPLGANEPINRLRQMLEAVGADLLVTDREEAIAPADCREVSFSRIPSAEAAAKQSVVSVDDPAYVIFTSGTSGTPKPVAISHRGIVNAVAWKRRTYDLSPSSRVLPVFGYEFDGFVLNVFGPLCSGATVILSDDEGRRAPAGIVRSIETEGVTHIVCAPVIYGAVLDHAAGFAFATLDTVTLAGEAAGAGLIARSNAMLPSVRLANEYGPTENAVVSTYHPDLTQELVRVIGRPISNVRLHILDDRLRPVPVGVTGEIYLGGPGLALGYAARVQPSGNTLVERDYKRLYRTGDHACWLPDGNVEFQGRGEGYLKVRGIRVDAEEIRAAILKCEGIREAAVLVNGPADNEVIEAFVVSTSPVSSESLASVLRGELPRHLNPARFVQVPALPLNAGGKLDHDALRALAALPVPHQGGIAPDDAVMRDLTAIWKNILEIEHVDPDDSFFALGGHSLRAVRLMAQIQETMGIELRLNEIYEASTIRRLRDVIARQKSVAAPRIAPIGDRPLEGETVLSSAQERMLALASEHPIAYNLPVLFTVSANLDLDRLRRAVETVVDRHAVLRGTFHPEGDRWVQRFDEKARVEIAERQIAAGADLETAARAAVEPFDLQRGPLLRLVLFSEGSAHRMLLIDFHHIVIDEASLRIVLRELAADFNGDPLPPLAPYSYADFASAQRRKQASEGYKADLADAVRNLKDNEAEPLRLPFDHPEPRRRSDAGKLVRGTIPGGLVSAIRELCASAEITEFTFFMAAFGLLLHKHTRQTNMVIGAPVSMRTGPETDSCVGLFLNTVPFHLDIRTDASFLDYLGTVKTEILEGLGRRWLEFRSLVRTLGTERAYAENPLFSVMLHMVDNSVTTLALDGVEASYRPLHTRTSKFDLILELNPDDGTGSFALEYPTQRFEENTIQRLADSFVTILADVIERPATSVRSLRSMSETERARILEWGRIDNGMEAYDDGSLASRFEQQVRAHPSNIALVDGREHLTYAELNARSNRLARKLLKLGVVENDIVGVFCERSAKVIVAILAVQKAGVAHLPLDPYYPAIRTGKMLANSGAQILITDQDIQALGFGGTVVHPGDDLSEFNPTDLRRYPRPESNAYVLYTSGTTGDPKGVTVGQRNIVALVHRATSMFGLDHKDVWTLFHSVCFDVSVWEMFGALLTGARLVIVPRELAADANGLLNLIETNGVTLLCQPPSAFYLLADAMRRAERPTALRYIILGGEAIKPENFSGWSDDMPTIVNGYGITETTVYSTFHIFSRREILERTRSIGRPVPGTHVYILDEEMRLCPVGVVGELYIGGVGVGNGYLGRPDLTRQRFVEDPFRPGRILYRSGDRVRWLSNGEIEYLGRADKQLKIRGYRVETSEVEAAMSAHSKVRESAVLAETRDTRTQLVGFFTSDIQEDTRRMRDHLENHLPDYMVPSRLVQVEKMPVTPNGKVDQIRLLAIPAAAPAPEDTVPRNLSHESSVERLLAKTWAHIIGISLDEIGPEDSFFTLGGDSIGANLVVKLLEKQGLPIELLDIFEHPALPDLAGLIHSRLWDQRLDGDSEPNAYWDALRATKTATLLPMSDRKAGTSAELSRVRVDISLSDLASIGAETPVRDILVTALCVALRMSAGEAGIRIALLSGYEPDISSATATGKLTVAPLVVTIDDIHDGPENLSRVTEGIRRAEENRLNWDTVRSNAALAEALAGSAVFNLLNGSNARADDLPTPDYLQLPLGCIGVESRIGGGSVTTEFVAQTGVNVSARLRFLAETFRLGLAEAFHALPTFAAPPLPATVSLDVEPFSDVFFRDCTYQAILTAARHLGGDINTLTAVATGVCVRSPHRSHGLRVAVDYMESHPFYQVLTDMGMTVRRTADTRSICDDLVTALAQGELGIVKLDCYHVEQHEDLYQTRHGDHTVLVCGYDQQRHFFDIVDNQPGRNILYRRTTIAFDDLRAAYDGYQHLFNPHGSDDSALFVSLQGGRGAVAADPSSAGSVLLDTLRLARSRREEEAAAFDLLHDDFRIVSASEASWSEHAERFMFTIGEVLLAKKLQDYQLGRILADDTLARPLREIIFNLSVVLGVLTKLRVSATYSTEKMDAMRTRLSGIRKLHLEYAEAVGRLLED